MNNTKLEINIAHLYPDLMNICGDTGNIIALEQRLKWRGINVNTTKIYQNDDIDYNKFDIFYIGGGEDKSKLLSEILSKHKNALEEQSNNGKVFLGICGGYQLLGNYIEDESGNKYNGLGLLNIYTKYNEKRFTGNVTAELDFLSIKTLVGFENHVGKTFLQDDTRPLGKILIGHGNNNKDNHEGARKLNVFGSYLHGPLLPKNHVFCDYLLQNAIRVKINDDKYILSTLNDELENSTHSKLENISY